MNLQDLRSFQVLAEESSWTVAARRLHVSEPTLSKRVQRLERHLSVTLMRTPVPSAETGVSGVSLTAAGAWVVSRASVLLELWQTAKDQTHLLDVGGPAARSPAAGRVRLAVRPGTSGTMQSYLSAAVPAHEVTVVGMPVLEALDRLEAEDGVDAVLMYPLSGAADLATYGVHVATVVLEPVWVILGARHRLAERDEITVEAIVEHGLPWIVSPPGDPVRRWEETFLLGRAPLAQLREAGDLSRVHIVQGRAAELAGPLNPPDDLLAARPLTPMATMHLYLAWQPHRLPDAAAGALLAAVRGFCRHRAQQVPRYWRWILDHPGHFPGIAPDLPPSSPESASASAASGAGRNLASLSGRELEVLTLVAAGFNDTEIAAELHLSPLTARAHVRNIRAKLGARDRIQLVVMAHQHGLTT